MSDDSSSLLEEERSLFRPFTRESLLGIEARIAEELEKQKELEKRRAEGEVRPHYISPYIYYHVITPLMA
jgi:voltage-gated sodium channel type II alpha